MGACSARSGGGGGGSGARVHVPKYTAVGSKARLTCEYDLGRDKLYSIKWYKDAQEFYRFVPKDRPPSQRFDVEATNVDVSGMA